MRYIAVKVAYTGEGFNGSQRQPYLRTVEGEIIRDLCLVCNIRPDTVDLRMAGRTDRGVNALGNVAVFNTDFGDIPTLLKALNANSERIFYRGYAEVPDDFNPRFADWREYEYILPSRGLDMDLVRKCASMFVGEHDFLRFCRPDGKPTVNTIDSITVTEGDGFIVLEFKARYYLWNMIRRISAAIYTVGAGKADISKVADALAGKEINFGLARADALTLTDTVYPDVEFNMVMGKTFFYRTDEETFRIKLRDRYYTALTGGHDERS